MKPIDFAKAAAVATALLALNVLIAVLVVFGYSILIEPGHPRAFYDSAALRIAPWSSHIAGTALFFGAGYLFARRRPQRNGSLFAAAFTVLYAIIDGATVGFAGVFAVDFALSMLAKLLAALAGADAVVHLAWMFQPTRRPAVTWTTNVVGTRRVLEASTRQGVGAVVLSRSSVSRGAASSISV